MWANFQLPSVFQTVCFYVCYHWYHTGTCEPRHDKTNNVAARPAKTQISLGICPVWSESSLSACRNLRSLAFHWAHSKDSDQTGRMPRLIWVIAGRTLILLVLSCRDSCLFHCISICRVSWLEDIWLGLCTLYGSLYHKCPKNWDILKTAVIILKVEHCG